jgi:hypothetical protein
MPLAKVQLAVGALAACDEPLAEPRLIPPRIASAAAQEIASESLQRFLISSPFVDRLVPALYPWVRNLNLWDRADTAEASDRRG